MAPVALNFLLEQAIELTRDRWCDMPLRRGVGLHLSWELAPNLPSVLGRDDEIRDALMALIARAVDAMPDGGHLTLRTFAVLDENGSGVALEISDTGSDGGPPKSGATAILAPHANPRAMTSVALVCGADVQIRDYLSQGTTVALLFRATPAPQNQLAPG